MKKYLIIALLLLSATAYGFGGLMMGSGTTTTSSGAWSTVWDAETVTGDSTWTDYDSSSRNIRVYLFNADITGSGTKIKVVLKANSGSNTVIDNVSIGPKKASSDAWDFDSAPTNVTFGSSDSVTISAGSTATSDEITFTLSASTDYIIAVQHGADSANKQTSYLDPGSGINEARHYVTTDETETVDVTADNEARFIEVVYQLEAFE